MGQILNKQEPKSVNFLPQRNMCDIGDHVTSVKGIASQSVSPSGQWLLDFANGTKYGDYSIKKGFLKWWIKPELVTDISRNVNYKGYNGENVIDGNAIAHLYGMNYETKLYSDVIHPLIVNHICPNFVKFLASGDTCNKSDLLKNLIDKTQNDKLKGTLTEYEIKENLNRNISWVYWQAQGRPSIGDIHNPNEYSSWEEYLAVNFNATHEPEYPASENNLEVIWAMPFGGKFNFFLTEAATDSIDLKTWIQQAKAGNNLSNSDFIQILFQIVYACYAMSLSKMVHNDLHYGNIWVKNLGEEKEVIYVIQNGTYTMKTRWKVMIYDFDFSHCEWKGKNEKVERDWVAQYNIAEYSDQSKIKDVAKIFAFIHSSISDDKDLSSATIELITKQDHVQRVVDMFDGDSGKFLGESGSGTMSSDAITTFSDWYVFHDHETILQNIANVTPVISISESWDPPYATRSLYSKIANNPPTNKHENIYFCTPKFFNTDGTLDQLAINQKFREIVNAYREVYL